MQVIKIKVTQTDVTITEKPEKITAENYNQIKCIFDLDEAFDNLIVRASFNGEYATVENGECFAPVLKQGNCSLGVYGYAVVEEKLERRISPSPKMFYVNEGSYNENDAQSDNPTPTELEEHYNRVKELVDSGKLKGNPGEKGEKGDKGDKGDTGATGATGPQGPPGKDAVTDTELSTESNNAIANSAVAKEFNKVSNFFDSKVTVTEIEKTYTGNATGTSQTAYYGFATRIRRPEKINGIRMYTMVTADTELTCQLLSADRNTVYAEVTQNVSQSDVPIFVDFVFENMPVITEENIYVAVKSNIKCITQAMTRSSNINTELVTADCLDELGLSNNCYFSVMWNPVKSSSNRYSFTLQFSILEIDEKHYAKVDLSEYEVARMNYVYVSPVGSDETGDGTEDNPYATIYHANEMITDNSQLNRYTIKVANGTYTDLQERYAGDTETLGTFQGVRTKNYVYYEGNIENPAACVIEWDGLAGFELETYNNDQAVDKCPFHIIGSYAEGAMHTSVRGFKIIGKNLRYAMHCETAGYGYGVEYEVGNLILEWYGRPDVIDNTNEIPAIGTGSSPLEKAYFHDISIDFHSVKNDGTEYRFGFQNHDNANKYTNAMPAVIGGASYRFENINFNDSRFQLRSLSETPAETFDVCEMKNCVGISLAQKIYVSPATKCNWQADVKMCDITDNQF